MKLQIPIKYKPPIKSGAYVERIFDDKIKKIQVFDHAKSSSELRTITERNALLNIDYSGCD